MRTRRPFGVRQRGVAVITALLLTTLAVTIVASLFWQQQVQVRSMENQRLQLQTRWILRGALDLCRLILRQDGIDSQGRTPSNGVWATPLEETRLDDYVERERLNGENFNATLSGRITDAQSRYNLANLSNGSGTVPGQLLVLQRLLTNLHLDPGMAQAVADQVARSRPAVTAAAGASQGGSGVAVGGTTTTSTGGTSGTGTTVTGTPVAAPADDGTLPMELVRVEDLLALSGFTPEAIERLRDFVIVLPERTDINVNTAPAELLAALMDNMSVSEAAAKVNEAKTAFFKDVPDFTSRSNGHSATKDVGFGVKSNYFLVFSKVRLDRAALDAQSLLKRQDGTFNTSVVWIREN